MKTSGGFVTRWMTDLINNIVREGDWRKNIVTFAVVTLPVDLFSLWKLFTL